MDIVSGLAHGFAVALQPTNLFWCFVGCFLGTIVGIMPGLGPAATIALLLPLTLKWAQEERLALPAALARLTSEPARVLGLGAGQLAPGAEADVCVFDPDAYWTVEPRALKSQGKNTPFLGLELPGRVRCTLVGGQVVYEG